MAVRHGSPGVPWLTWQRSGLLAIPLGLVAVNYGFGLGHAWRETVATSPTDPDPAAGLLRVAVLAGAAIVVGLGLLLRTRGPIGPILFALGVGVTCGVAIGFFVSA